MLTHKEELVLSRKRTSSIMLTFLGYKREQFARVAPFMLKTHILLVLFIFLPNSWQIACHKCIYLITTYFINNNLSNNGQLPGFTLQYVRQRRL